MDLELSQTGYPLKKRNLSWCASWRGVRGVVQKKMPDCCSRASSIFANAGPYSSHECFQELRLQLPRVLAIRANFLKMVRIEMKEGRSHSYWEVRQALSRVKFRIAFGDFAVILKIFCGV